MDLRDDLRIGAAGSEGCVVVPLQVRMAVANLNTRHNNLIAAGRPATVVRCHGLHALHTRRVKYDKRRRANL